MSDEVESDGEDGWSCPFCGVGIPFEVYDDGEDDVCPNCGEVLAA